MKEATPSSVWEIPDRRLNLDTTGILFFDFTNYSKKATTARSSEELKKRAQVLANAVKIQDAARKRGMPLIFTGPDHRADGKDTPARLLDCGHGYAFDDPEMFHVVIPDGLHGQWEAQIVEDLTPAPEDTIILKHRWSAFHRTHLDLSLRMLGLETLAILGGALEVGNVYRHIGPAADFHSFLDALEGTFLIAHMSGVEALLRRHSRADLD